MSLQRIFATTLNSPVARAFLASSLITLPGCAVMREAPEPGAAKMPEPAPAKPPRPRSAAAPAPRGDDAITAIVKAKFEHNTTVDADAIGVVTQDRVVTLSGVARSTTERTMAETLARSVSGVKSVTNAIVVRP